MRDGLASVLHPTTRFFWGLSLLATLLFAGNWEVRGVLAVLGAVLAVAAGKRVNFWYFTFLIFTIVFFNLLLPVGKVWFRLGPWAVTEGAFFLGLGKGFTFTGLVFFSLASVSRGLRLPGRFGALWGLTFAWYEQLMDQRRALKPRALLMSIDRLLERLYPTRAGSVPREPVHRAEQTKTSAAGWILAISTLVSAVAVSTVWR